jgi:hypothetical protein
MKTKLSFLSRVGRFIAQSAFILFIAMALGACASEEVIDTVTVTEDEANAINFGTFMDRTPAASASQSGTKPLGAVLDLPTLKNTGFTVLAYETGTTDWTGYTAPATPNFMNDQAVTWSTSVWEYTPIKYWPRSGTEWSKVTFFGFSTVAGASADGKASSNPKITFTTDAAVASQVDLVADADFNVTKVSASGKVKFQFDHILSKIGFTAKLATNYEPATVTVTSLRVYYKDKKVNSSGTYTFSNSDNLAAGNWALTDAATFTQASGGSGDQIFSGSTPATLTTTATDNKLSDPSAYLMLIPQAVTAGDVYVELNYDVSYSDTPVSVIHNLSTIDLPAITWLPGKAYTYNFTLTLNPVVFDTDISVNNWADGSQPNDTPFDS